MNKPLSHTAPPHAATAIWQRLGRAIPTRLRASARRSGQFLHARHIDANDALLLSYPKSGSSWLRNMLAAVRKGELIDPSDLAEWIPPLHYSREATHAKVIGMPGRMIRSHDHARTPGFGRAGRCVILVRDPRAVAVSLHFHMLRRGATNSTIVDTAREITSRSGTTNLGSWQRHAAVALEAPEPWALLVKYEDLMASPRDGLARICDHLGWPADQHLLELAIEGTRPGVLRDKRIASGMDAHDDPIGGVRRASPTSWQQECPAEAQSIIVESAADQMRRLGYLM